MSWLYSQVLVEEYLGDISSDGEQSVQSSGNPIPQAYCAPDKMTAFSRLSRFGMTFKPLTEDLGEELLMSYREVFLVRTSLQQEKVSELKVSGQECGEKWRGSFVKWDQDSSLWRTHQCSLLGDLEPFSETWPQWGLMRNGECWEQQTLEQTIRGTGYGLEERLPTPTASDYKNQPTSASWKAKGAINYKLSNPEIQAKWPTPTATDYMGAKQNGIESRNGRYVWTSLTTGVKFGAKLTDAVNLEVKKKFPTPKLSDYKDRGNMSNPSIQRRAAKGKQMDLSMVAHPTSGQLNPTWVEKLMGWPADWTCIDNISHTKMMFWIMGFYDDKERCTNQILQMLRQGNVSKEIQQQIGRPVCILETSVLLTQLCEYSNRPNEAWVFFSCQKILEDEMRGLRSQQETSSSSHRSEYQEQFGKQHSDTMQALSRLLAYDGKEAWKNNSWEDAIPRVGKNIIARMERIKAIGNGQVPLCAATAWRILK